MSMSMSSLRKEVVLVVACAVALASCSTAPIARWKRESPATSGVSMTGALGYLDTARTAYRDAVADQMDREASLSSALVVGGALVAILAASRAPRDAIFGVAAIGGTSYALGNMSLRRQRVLTYQAGVEALNCAQRAVIPFDIPQDEAQALVKSLNALDSSRLTLVDTLARAQSIRDGLPAGSQEKAPLDTAISLAMQTRAAADSTMKSGRQFVGSLNRASRELVAAVDRIDAAVTRSVIDGSPDLSNVPKVIAGLAGMMGIFAPGVEGRVTDGLASYATATAKSDLTQTPAQKIMQQLAIDALATASLTSSVNDRLANRVTAWPEDAFKDCGVAQVVTDLTVDPASLNFVAGVESHKGFDIAGGVKPYFVQLDGQVVDGVNVRSPVRFDNHVEVTVLSNVTDSYSLTLRVTDSSPTARVLNMTMAIAPAAAASSPAAAASKPRPPSSAPKEAGTGTGKKAIDLALDKLGAKGQFIHAGKTFIVSPKPALSDATTISLGVTCPPGDTTKYRQADLAASLITQAQVNAGPPKPAWNIRITGACLAD
jgi:hypothetical protein